MTDRTTRAAAAHRLLDSRLLEGRALLRAAVGEDRLPPAALAARGRVEDQLERLAPLTHQADVMMDVVLVHLDLADQAARARGLTPAGAL